MYYLVCDILSVIQGGLLFKSSQCCLGPVGSTYIMQNRYNLVMV